ncbi:MAG: RIO1 family regulatory kinase/ATPase [Candidatus Bathyarchaeia archaeon]
MKQISNLTNHELNNQIFEFCRHVAGSASITAIAQVDKYTVKTASEKTVIDVMLVIRDFQPRVMSYIKTVNERPIFVFAVDQWIFERDIERGFLGEAIASKLIFPHSALYGDDYLHEKEVTLKKRLILELLENLASSFPELSPRIQIKPQYFMYEVLLSRIRVFPLLAYDLSNVLNGLALNEDDALGSYNEALRQLEAEGKIYFFDSYIKISKKLITRCQDPRIKIINLSKNAPRTLFTSLFGFFPQLMNIFSQNTEAFLRTQKINWRTVPDPTYLLMDPLKYVFFQTSEGLISMSDKIDIKGYAQKMLLKGQSEDVKVEPIGGMLNDVYLIVAHGNDSETRVIAKRFKDWSGFKWFPLTLWSFGARSFAVSGQARLAKECAISEFLRSEGFNVPKILHVSNAERLIFMEYIEGESLSQAIKRIATATEQETFEEELANLSKAGEILAHVHSHNIVLGDTKPENMLVTSDGTIYMIDFEQAAQDADGDKAWDVAVFLYYSGHYLQPLYGNAKAEAIAKAFINGYLKGGGDVEVVKKAGASKYTRIFSIFTMFTIISVISNVCKKTETPK